MIKDGKLWVHALEDCVVSAPKPICKFWGNCVGSEKKKVAKYNDQNYMLEMNSLDFVGAILREETIPITLQGPSPLASCRSS